MTPCERGLWRRLFPGMVMMLVGVTAAAMLLGHGTSAGAQAASAFGVLEECAPVGGCVERAERRGLWAPGTQLASDVWPIASAHAGSAGAAAQDADIDPQGLVVWSSKMTVGKSDIASIGYLGFVTGDWPDTGTIDDVAFTHDGMRYVVTALYHPIVTGNPNHLFFHMDRSLPEELSLQVGPDEFAVSDALILGPKRNIYHWYLDSSLDWSAGDEMAVSLVGISGRGDTHEWLVKNVPPSVG